MIVRNALIAGATGLVGSELVSLLIENNYYTTVHLLTRRPYHLKHRKIADHVIDFDLVHQFNPDVQIHDVYICLGTTIKKAGSQADFIKVDLDYVVNIAKWAKLHHAEKLAFISSVGANAETSNFYLSVKGKAENALKEIGFTRLVLLRPSLLLGNRKESRIAETISKFIFNILKPLFTGRLKRYKAVEAKLVARAMFYYTIHSESPLSVIENEQIFDVANQKI